MRQNHIMVLFYNGLRTDYLGACGGFLPTPAFDYCIHRSSVFAHLNPLTDRPEILLPSLLTGKFPDTLNLYPDGLARTDETLVDLAQRAGYRVLVRQWLTSDPGRLIPAWTHRDWQIHHFDQLFNMLTEDELQPALILDQNRALTWRIEQQPEAYHSALQDGMMREEERLYQILTRLQKLNLHRHTTLVLIGTGADQNPTARRILNQEEGTVPLIIVPPFGQKIVPSTPKKGSMVDVGPTVAALLGSKFTRTVDGVNLAQLEAPPRSNHIFTLTEPTPQTKNTGPIPNPDDHVLRRAVFVFCAMRSASLFFSEFFAREEFGQILTCLGHNQPHWERANLLYGAGLFDEQQVKRELLSTRPYLDGIRTRFFLSVSHDCSYIASIIAEVFPNSKFIFISRDGRTQIRSRLSYQRIFADQRLEMQRYPNWRETPPPNISHEAWLSLDEFSRCCLVWQRVSSHLHQDISALGPRGLHVQFEDIFNAGHGFPGMAQIRDFLSDEFEIPHSKEWLNALLTKKRHADFYHFPKYAGWRPEQKKFFKEHAQTTMEALGYTMDEP